MRKREESKSSREEGEGKEEEEAHYSRLVDDSHHLETSNDSGVFRRLSLSVIEVGRNSDYCMGDRVTQVSLSCFLCNRKWW